MELPVLSQPNAFGAPASGVRPVAPVQRRPEPRFEEFEVPLPADLRRFGSSVKAAASGDPANPTTVIALGGISGNRFVCRRADGAPGWWAGLVGPGAAVDPHRHYVVGVDFAADETGTVAPSTADQAQVLAAVLDHIGVARTTIVGASYGGMVALALAEAAPERVEKLVVISAGAEPHPAATAARELQRRVVALGIESGKGEEALAIARGMAMLTYRTPREFGERFEGGIDDPCPRTRSQPGCYLSARGEDFLSVMSPGRFLSLSASIDRHLVDPARISAPALLIGADSDQLVFADQMRALASALAGPAELRLLCCLYGHDMFLKEVEAVGKLVAPFLAA